VIRVKICGMTRLEDAELAIDLGADAIGFIFWPGSPRAITAERVAVISRRLPPFVTRVGVFVNAAPAEVRAMVTTAGLDAVQLHGDEAVEDFDGVNARILRGMSVEDDDALDLAVRLPAHVMPLVDAADRSRRGGTGQLADWDRAYALAGQRPIILAGGLTAENVSDAVRRVRPWGIDVSSGVEDAPGIKNADRLRALFDEVARLRAEGL
jgi:phosphoribosylanthranilate isomerase